MPFDFQEIIKGFGLPTELSVRLSRGVVGRTTYAIITLFVVLAVILSRINPDMLIWVGVLAVVVYVIYLFGVLGFAHRHPGASLLEGAELLHWQQAELAAKGTGPMPTSTPLPPASNAPLELPASTLDEAEH